MFALVAAIALRARGWTVTLIEQHTIGALFAASVDISKAVRADYGRDDDYCEAMLSCIARWAEWNTQFDRPLYHNTGVSYLARSPMSEGGFEWESYVRLRRHGVAVERLDSSAIFQRFGAWREGYFCDGYVNPLGGWVQSGAVVQQLAKQALAMGVTVRERERVRSVRELTDGVEATLESAAIEQADMLLRCAGSWSAHCYPELRGVLRCSGHPVFHLRPTGSAASEVIAQLAGARFPSFGADISRSGWYGFPWHPEERVLKIAQHREGRAVHPESADCVVNEQELQAMWSFVQEALPALASAQLVRTRLCCYADTPDGNFLIDSNPEGSSRVVYATGDSGHGFKFAPVLGDWIADVVCGKRNVLRGKFAWKNRATLSHGDQARSLGLNHT